jgi:hypothetical protein
MSIPPLLGMSGLPSLAQLSKGADLLARYAGALHVAETTLEYLCGLSTSEGFVPITVKAMEGALEMVFMVKHYKDVFDSMGKVQVQWENFHTCCADNHKWSPPLKNRDNKRKRNRVNPVFWSGPEISDLEHTIRCIALSNPRLIN